MKKLVVFIAVLTFLILSVTSFAQENQSSDSARTQVKYDLPYPGLLPDSPLYFLRASRDRIISFLISDSLKKAEFDLLQADKRLAAGIYLGNKGKYSLAVTTISKGENYLEEALAQIEQARKDGKIVRGIALNISLSSQKHQEILKELEQKVNGQMKEDFIVEERRAVNFEKKAKLILSDK